MSVSARGGNNLHVPRREPLNSQRGPGERVRIDRVVEEGRVLLPDLVLFKDALLFDFVNIVDYGTQLFLSLIF